MLSRRAGRKCEDAEAEKQQSDRAMSNGNRFMEKSRDLVYSEAGLAPGMRLFTSLIWPL